MPLLMLTLFFAAIDAIRVIFLPLRYAAYADAVILADDYATLRCYDAPCCHTLASASLLPLYCHADDYFIFAAAAITYIISRCRHADTLSCHIDAITPLLMPALLIRR